MATPEISLIDAGILGVVEGLTEFLPVSSTGHLILMARWLGLDLDDPGVKAFQIVIQAGALLAVIGIYRRQVGAMTQGILGRNPEGLNLLWCLLAGFAPAVVVGLAAGDWIKETLFGTGPVIAALAVGGVVMIAVEWWRARREQGVAAKEIGAMTIKAAVIIGCCQCIAMWPGTSRSMVTIVGALLLGFHPRAAAEFSFLLALPTLGAATCYDMLKDGDALLDASGVAGLVVGLVVSAVVAWAAVRGFLAYLTRRGLMPFGIYRLILAGAVAILR